MKTLLVLTDGMDNRFGKNRSFFPEIREIPAFIPKFNELGVRVNMVFFSTPFDKKEEIDQARTNFAGPLGQLNPPGSFVTAENRVQLIQTLSHLLKQELACQILTPDGTMVGGQPLNVTTPPGQDDQWSIGMEPGIYKLRVVADRTYERDVDLKKGDRLLVKLVPAGSGIGFERVLYSDDFETRVEEDLPEWRLAGLASPLEQRGDITRLQALNSLEKKPAQRPSGRHTARAAPTGLVQAGWPGYPEPRGGIRREVAGAKVLSFPRVALRCARVATRSSRQWPGKADPHGLVAEPRPEVLTRSCLQDESGSKARGLPQHRPNR